MEEPEPGCGPSSVWLQSLYFISQGHCLSGGRNRKERNIWNLRGGCDSGQGRSDSLAVAANVLKSGVLKLESSERRGIPLL